MPIMTKKLFLLDAHALIYRAHFAFVKRPLINSKGLNVSSISGFIQTVWDVLQKEKPTHIAVAFDLPTPTFRHVIYEPYKGNREEQPEDITLAIPIIQEILKGFRIPILTKEGYEADDVIGTIAKKAEKEGFTVYMMTSDKDYSQLVSDSVFLYRPQHFGNGIDVMGVKEVLEKWGIRRVEQVTDMLGLQGDAVDNIPGVKGIGPKSAIELIGEYDTVENILAHTEQLKDRYRKLIEANKENALLSKQLATIEVNVPIEFHDADFAVKDFDIDRLLAIFKELEFRSLTQKISALNKPSKSAKPAEQQQTDLFGNVIESDDDDAPKPVRIVDRTIQNTPHEYHLVENAEQRAQLIHDLLQQKIICFDTETTGLETHAAELVGMSFAFEAHKAYYLPLPDKKAEAQAIVDEFRSVLENPHIAKIGQNLKFDMSMLQNYGVRVEGAIWDTMLMHYILEPEKRHGMDYLAENYLKYAPISIETLIGKRTTGKVQLTMRDIAIEKIKDYAAEDADVTYQLYQYFLPLLQGDLLKLYETIEAPLVSVLSAMEREGIRVDAQLLNEYAAVLDGEIKGIKQRVYEAAGVSPTSVNLDSPRQVGELLFEKMGIHYPWKKTKTQQYSTDEEKLSEIADAHPIIQHILEYRQLAKLKSTYIEALPLLINPKTGRIHSSFHQALTATGRLSSQNPNLQNIPIRSEKGREIRKAFVPRDAEHVLLAADYSQIELRLMAEMSKDEAMVEAFRLGQDIHRATAARIYDVPLDQVTKEQRYNAKTINFSIIYGAGATNISKNLGIKRVEAQKLIEDYFNQHPGVKRYMETTVHDARERGYAVTLCGRRRYLRDLSSRNGAMRSHAERNAINMPIQGTAADMIKLAMIQIDAALRARPELKTKLILQVHDELLFDVPRNEVDTVRDIIKHQMETALPGLSVPIVVEIGVGENWLEAH